MRYEIRSESDVEALPVEQREACLVAFDGWRSKKALVSGVGDANPGGVFVGAVAKDLVGLGDVFVWDDEAGAPV